MAASALLLAAGLSLSNILCRGVTAAPQPAAAQQWLTSLDFDGTPSLSSSASIIPAAGSQQSRKLHGKFLHVTDFHPDEFYKVHSSTAADHACHSGKGTAGTYGAETSDCDAPISLINATFDWISANIRDEIDFVVWTGDNARHDSDETIPRSAGQVLGTNRLLASKFADTFSDANGLNIPVIPTFGNNDILPHNILLPGPNKWLAYYADIWRDFIPEAQRHSFEFGGWFYVEVIPNKLAVFSLNTLYFFDRNAAIDDCVKPSEPGFKHLEWLRVQLQFMRDRGMKAILMGHVPPARTDSKMLWDETCWQKYTLWLRQYRDVVITGLYGHMNIDHFLLSDAKEITIDSTETGAQDLDFSRQNLDDELSIQSATDYLEELRKGWAKLPKARSKDESEKKSKKKNKKDNSKKSLGGKWAERYQVSFVGPSIVPNYFPTLRVYEYNITGMEDVVTWAENTDVMPTIDILRYDEDDEEGFLSHPELELRSSQDVEVANKKKKKKKGKDGKKPRDPNLTVPKPPAKSSPPGPAYSLQPLTLLGYKQYFANLTYLNNDIASKEQIEVGPEKWREGKHRDKEPKSSKPKPREFKFELEYATYDDKLYNLSDLTVRSFVELAYKMGQAAKSKSTDLIVQGADIAGNLDEVDGQDPEILNDGESSTDDEDDVKETEEDDEVDAKKKKKKKKAKKVNKTWLHFLKHAFISTVDDKDLEKRFS